MQIPFLDLQRELKDDYEKIMDRIERVVKSGWYILGQEKLEFEKKFASYCGVLNCVGVANGMEALQLIFQSYIELGELQKGDEVIVPANTFIATALAVSQCGLVPVFADCDEKTYNLSRATVEEKITSKTKAILVVHLYGQASAIDDLKELAEQHQLKLVEDAAQAHGAIYNETRTGALGDAAAFSFYPTKNLGALGDAGAITTNDATLAEMVRELSNYGSKNRYQYAHKGINSRLDEMQAAVLSLNLAKLDDNNNKRRDIARRYLSGIKNKKIINPSVNNFESHVFHIYAIRSSNREDLKKYLQEKGISTEVHYPKVIHKGNAYKEFATEKLPVSERLQHEVLSIPIFPSLTNEEVDYVVDTLNNW